MKTMKRKTIRNSILASAAIAPLLIAAACSGSSGPTDTVAAESPAGADTNSSQTKNKSASCEVVDPSELDGAYGLSRSGLYAKDMTLVVTDTVDLPADIGERITRIDTIGVQGDATAVGVYPSVSGDYIVQARPGGATELSDTVASYSDSVPYEDRYAFWTTISPAGEVIGETKMHFGYEYMDGAGPVESTGVELEDFGDKSNVLTGYYQVAAADEVTLPEKVEVKGQTPNRGQTGGNWRPILQGVAVDGDDQVRLLLPGSDKVYVASVVVGDDPTSCV